jgi:acetyl-CoA carboxylase biotin carboxyl carrier protein
VTDEPVPALSDESPPPATGSTALAADTATDPAPPDGAGLSDATTVRDDGDASLLALIDRLAAVLERSDLSELEVESGDTALVLRKPVTVASPPPVLTTDAAGQVSAPGPTGSTGAGDGTATAARPSVKAPLTGIFYGSPSPGSPPYVQVGGEVAVGQVIGLIEAMKLFNEIKSDLAGRVVRVVAESGQLVKARQPLIEVEQL